MDEQAQLPESAPTDHNARSAEADSSSETALVPAIPPDERDGLSLTGNVARLPVELDVAIPVRDFRVRHLLVLEPGQVVQTQWRQGDDMPLAARDTQLAWSEFEVIDSRLAVRVTRLA